MSDYPSVPDWVWKKLHSGLVIPAHPLALTRQRRLDERRQCALTRYYHAAGAGGIAVGVHTTQFEIRARKHKLLEPVLRLAGRIIAECDRTSGTATVRIAGICGPTQQALNEAKAARTSGYHLGLLSLGALKQIDDKGLMRHCRAVAQELPLFGFYLQPAVGGRVLSYQFWRRFVEIPNVAAIKIAAFDRYRTLEVIRAVAESGRTNDIALYTGNDDSIVADLLTEYHIPTSSGERRLRMVGGLLGHWACWTQAAVKLLGECRASRKSGAVPYQLLTRAAEVTDCNAAFFDAANGFRGCIPGIHEVLRRQKLLTNTVCLDPRHRLSPGQREQIARVYKAYPHLNDDQFVQANLSKWLT